MASKRDQDPRDADRQAELDRQAAVEKAVHDATHDKAGKPIPIAANPPITLVEGKP